MFYLLIYKVYNGFPAITKFTKGIDSFGNIPYFCCRKQYDSTINQLTNTDMRTYYDVIGKPIEAEGNQPCVTATDKMLSGWGRAVGKTHKQVVICATLQQAYTVADNMRRRGFTYVNVRRGVKTYPASRYTYSIHHADDCPLWNK